MLNLVEHYKLYRNRLPYIVNDYLGIDMSYYIANQTPDPLMVLFNTYIFNIDFTRARNDKKEQY